MAAADAPVRRVCWALWLPRLGRLGMPVWCPMAPAQGQPGPECGNCALWPKRDA